MISATIEQDQRPFKNIKILEQEDKTNRLSAESPCDPRADWLESISNIMSSACKHKRPNEIFRQIGSELGKMRISSVFFIKQPVGDSLDASNVTLASGGVPVFRTLPRRRANTSISPGNSELLERVLLSGDIAITTDAGVLAQLFPPIPGGSTAPAGPVSYVCAPLGEAAGVFGVLVAATSEITPLKMKYIAILAQIASMSHPNGGLNAEIDTMREKMQSMEKDFRSVASGLDRSVQDMVYALTIPMEMRDPYTSGHQIRVTNIAVAIAEEMGVAQRNIDGLKLAASIHDIGKIVIPFEILNRPTRLSEAELNLIKMHPQVAFEMLSPISFRWPIAEIVRQHHERADGSGYPRGLKSGETLLEARILAVADVVEAMSSHRPYRASLGIDAALEEVSSSSGILYDSEAVAACIRLLLIKNFSFEGALPTAMEDIRSFKSFRGCKS